MTKSEINVRTESLQGSFNDYCEWQREKIALEMYQVNYPNQTCKQNEINDKNPNAMCDF